jgi:hypothetical protein
VGKDWNNCASCVFYGDGLCRRSPPVLTFRTDMGAPKGQVRKAEAHWPPVKDDDWCGEHRGNDEEDA